MAALVATSALFVVVLLAEPGAAIATAMPRFYHGGESEASAQSQAEDRFALPRVEPEIIGTVFEPEYNPLQVTQWPRGGLAQRLEQQAVATAQSAASALAALDLQRPVASVQQPTLELQAPVAEQESEEKQTLPLWSALESMANGRGSVDAALGVGDGPLFEADMEAANIANLDAHVGKTSEVAAHVASEALSLTKDVIALQLPLGTDAPPQRYSHVHPPERKIRAAVMAQTNATSLDTGLASAKGTGTASANLTHLDSANSTHMVSVNSTGLHPEATFEDEEYMMWVRLRYLMIVLGGVLVGMVFCWSLQLKAP